jgi:hypothetical protein
MNKCPLLLFVVALMTTLSFTQEKKGVATKDAPQAIGLYSQAIKAGGFVFTAGQIPIDSRDGPLIPFQESLTIRPQVLTSSSRPL